MLPSLATVADLSARIPGGVSSADNERAKAALQDASALVRSEAGLTWLNDDGDAVEDVPDVVVAVTIAVARRAFVNPDMLASESIQDYSATFASSSSDIYLTKAEKQTLRRVLGRIGIWTQATTRVDIGGDVPAVAPLAPYDAPTETSDPFAEGWTG